MRMRGCTHFAFAVFICVYATPACAAYALNPAAPDIEINLDALGPAEKPVQDHTTVIIAPPDDSEIIPSANNLPLLKPVRPAAESSLPAAEPRLPAAEPRLPAAAINPPPSVLPLQRPFTIATPATLPAIRPETFPASPEETPPAELPPETTVLSFDGNETSLTPSHIELMQSLVGKASQGKRFQIIGYATGEDGLGNSARKISLSRALALRQFFIENDIDPVHIDVRALGAETDRTPIDRVDIIFYQETMR